MEDAYNTPLTPEEMQVYEAWAQAGGRDPVKERQDYDLQGLYKSGASLERGAHTTDRYKKPNHPTFSNESQYHGVDGHEGGVWQKRLDNTFSFIPGKSNLENWGPLNLQNYFSTYEKGNQLVLPEQQ